MERRHWSVLTAAVLGLAATGCGVKQGALDQQLSALRSEMRDSDAALAENTQQLSTRQCGNGPGGWDCA